MEGTTRIWHATIPSPTHTWLAYRNNCSSSNSSGNVRCVLHNIRSSSRLYTCSCAFLLCSWLVHATLFWLFWSWCWQLPSHRHQLRWWRSPFYWWLGTNLIHDFTAVTFSVKLVFFREKRPFPWNPWFFVNFNAFTVIYEGFQSLQLLCGFCCLLRVTLQH